MPEITINIMTVDVQRVVAEVEIGGGREEAYQVEPLHHPHLCTLSENYAYN